MMRASWRSSLRALGLAALLLLGGCQVELLSGLQESDANEMTAILLQSGISASKSQAKNGTDTILVDKPDFARAVELLQSRGLPRHKFANMGDVFRSSGLVASPMQERARFLWALGQELSGTVAQIDGVLTARVQVVLPDNDLLARDPTAASASVFVRYDEQSEVGKLVPQIKMLVADSVQGLDYDKVSVVMVPVPHVILPSSSPARSGEVSGLASAAAVLLVLGGIGFTLRRRIAAALAAVRLAASTHSGPS